MHKRTVRNNGKGERKKKRKKFPTGDFLLGGKEGIGGGGWVYKSGDVPFSGIGIDYHIIRIVLPLPVLSSLKSATSERNDGSNAAVAVHDDESKLQPDPHPSQRPAPIMLPLPRAIFSFSSSFSFGT